LSFFSYVLERGVGYLVLCDKSFSKRLAFTYLEDLQTEFQNQYGARVHTVSRPYHFIEFGEQNSPFTLNSSLPIEFKHV
jgi:vesicle transport protein SEC22